jgi:tetratricopeptide (TPR) repeat protein
MMQGKYGEAEQQFMDVRANGRPIYGDNFPVVRDATHEIMRLYVMQERDEAFEHWCREELNRLAQSDDDNRHLQASILNGMAWYQATYPSAMIRNGTEAVKNATKAYELTDRNVASYVDTLAAAYAEAGDFAMAARKEKEAIELIASQDGIPRKDQNLGYHLELLESGHVIRESFLSWRARTMLHEAIYTGWLPKYYAAERELTAALAAARRFLGETHPETRGCILGFIELYEAWDKPAEVAKWRAQLASEQHE